MRKAFNFYRSYFDVFKELSDKDKLAFITALLERQFDGKEPELKGMANFAYLSQKFNIDSQVTGYETKTKEKLTPTVGGEQGGSIGASVQDKGKEEEEVKGKDIPTSEIFLTFCKETLADKYYPLEFSLKAKYEAWLSDGWKDGNGAKIKNWKTKIKNTIPFLKPMQQTGTQTGATLSSNWLEKK